MLAGNAAACQSYLPECVAQQPGHLQNPDVVFGCRGSLYALAGTYDLQFRVKQTDTCPEAFKTLEVCTVTITMQNTPYRFNTSFHTGMLYLLLFSTIARWVCDLQVGQTPKSARVYVSSLEPA
jgi:hypothetical protein